ncbi:hypothetical protein F4823DRAFT_557482 [Ustulina deusta]|nr:hypothetical protein F4823DRAFT_557482 [Ustulina deusta]
MTTQRDYSDSSDNPPILKYTAKPNNSSSRRVRFDLPEDTDYIAAEMAEGHTSSGVTPGYAGAPGAYTYEDTAGGYTCIETPTTGGYTYPGATPYPYPGTTGYDHSGIPGYDVTGTTGYNPIGTTGYNPSGVTGYHSTGVAGNYTSTGATGQSQQSGRANAFPRSPEDRVLERGPVQDPAFWQGDSAQRTWNYVQSGKPTKGEHDDVSSAGRGNRELDEERAHNVRRENRVDRRAHDEGGGGHYEGRRRYHSWDRHGDGHHKSDKHHKHHKHDKNDKHDKHDKHDKRHKHRAH